MKRVKFQDRLRKSFLGYSGQIMALTALLYLGAFLLNTYVVVICSCRENSRRASQMLSEQLESYTVGMEQLCRNQVLLSAVELGGDKTEANRILYGFANQQRLRPYFALVSADGELICSNFSSENRIIFKDSVFLMKIISRMGQQPGKILCCGFTAPVSSVQACCLSLCRAFEKEDGGIGGYLIFNLRQQSFQDAFSRQGMLLTDHYDNVIYTTLELPEDPQEKLPSGKYAPPIKNAGIVTIGVSRYFGYRRILEHQGLKLYAMICLDTHLQMLWYGLGFFVLMLIILGLVLQMMTKAFSRQNAVELSELKSAVEQMEANSGPMELSERCSEETQDLYDHFHTLIRDNNELIDLRRQMEIKHLESQFNPHFVFNIMETIRYQIDFDPQAASRMLRSFAALMRYSIHYGATKVPLETDVEYINDYLLLQKARYNNFLHYEFQIPEELLDCRVPKLMLQPVIENSIKHGYQAGRMLTIAIRAEQEGDDLKFTVEDNGRGMETEHLESIRRSLEREPDAIVAEHVGLYNIHKAIRLSYGPGYGLEIESTVSKGTTVTLKIPYEMEE